MERWRRGWEQIGGRNAVTVWSWILTIPLTLVVSSTYAGSPSLREVLTWQSIVLGVHVILGGAMWVAVMTVLPHTERRSRPITAVLFFGSLGLARALLLQWAQDVVGISGGVFSERLAVNIVGAIVALSVIAIVVDDYRTNEAIIQRLESARATLERLRVEEQTALRAADVEILAEVHQRVERELARSESDPGRIRAIADEIVRPISHELVSATADPEPAGAPAGSTSARLSFAQAFGRMVAPSPAAVAIVVEATILSAVAVRFGVALALANAIIGGALIALGCWLLMRLLPLPKASLGRLLTLTISLACVGAGATLLAGLVLPPLRATFPAGLIGVSGGVAGAGIAIALWAAVNAGRRIRQEEMARTVSDEAQAVEHLRSSLEIRRLQAARFLHGAIQGELIAASLRGDTSDDVRDIMQRRFAEYGAATDRHAEPRFMDVIAAWGTVLDITVDVDPRAWVVLDQRPGSSELLADALSEAFANAVRHASSPSVDVAVVAQELEVVLTVRSEGETGSAGETGIGLAQLRTRGLRVNLTSREGRTELTVRLG